MILGAYHLIVNNNVRRHVIVRQPTTSILHTTLSCLPVSTSSTDHETIGVGVSRGTSSDTGSIHRVIMRRHFVNCEGMSSATVLIPQRRKRASVRR